MIFLLRQSTALRYSIRQSPSFRRGRLPLPVRSSVHMMKHASSDASSEMWAPTGAPGSLERLCSVSLRACQLMNPLILSIYHQLECESDSNAGVVQKLKQDNSAFTIADGLVQRLLVEILYSQISFRDIVGEEEDECHHVNEDTPKGTLADDESWFTVQGLTIPTDLRPSVESTKATIGALAATHFLHSSETDDGIHKCLGYQHLTVFIDPIDGTREFSTGKGEQCSVCIGFADENGKAVAGVIYRPLSQPKPTWVAGAKAERFAACDFGRDKVIHSFDDRSAAQVHTNIDENKKRGSLLTTNGSISPFVESLIEELQTERVKSGGAGNKLMMLLEQSLFGNHDDGGRALYIQDRGVSRWDTCGAEGVLEAFGGRLMKLTTFLPETMDGENAKQTNNYRDTYTYLASQTNLDFIPGVATITKYNCSPSTKDVQGNHKSHDVNEVKPYSNLCGLVAFGKRWNTPEGIKFIEKAIERAARIHLPAFD